MKLQAISKECSGCGTCKLICSLINFKVAAPSMSFLNIEGRFPAPGDYIIHTCTQCGACAEVCPVEAITLKDGVYVIDPEDCIGCGECIEQCPENVMILLGENQVAAKCISCGECVDICPRDALKLTDNMIQETIS